MPHKRNPVLSENLTGLAQPGARDRGHPGAGERRTLARARHQPLQRRARHRTRTPPSRWTSPSSRATGLIENLLDLPRPHGGQPANRSAGWCIAARFCWRSRARACRGRSPTEIVQRNAMADAGRRLGQASATEASPTTSRPIPDDRGPAGPGRHWPSAMATDPHLRHAGARISPGYSARPEPSLRHEGVDCRPSRGLPDSLVMDAHRLNAHTAPTCVPSS